MIHGPYNVKSNIYWYLRDLVSRKTNNFWSKMVLHIFKLKWNAIHFLSFLRLIPRIMIWGLVSCDGVYLFLQEIPGRILLRALITLLSSCEGTARIWWRFSYTKVCYSGCYLTIAYKPYFFHEKCKFLYFLFGPVLNLYFEKFQLFRMLFFHPTLFRREIFSLDILGCNIHDACVAKGL